MAQPTISDLIAVAASNTDYNGIGILGTNLVSTADDAFRMLAQMLAGYSKDLAGLGTVGGTANAITLIANQPWAALANGLVLAFKNTVGPNTGATTLAVTNSAAVSLGTKAIRLQGDTALVGGEMLANGIYLLRYDTAYNSAAGAWVLLNPAAMSLSGQSIVASATSTPIGAAATREVIISGTTTITSFDTVAAGTERVGYFSGALILTYNATSLILPGAANITTAAGDSFYAVSLGGGNWKVLTYTPVAAAPPSTGTWTPQFFGSGCTFSYAAQEGTYTKIGNLVIVNFRIALNVSGNTLTANPLSIGNLPFTSAASPSELLFPVNWFGATSSYVSMSVDLAPSAIALGVRGATAAATANTAAINASTALNATAGSIVYGNFCYRSA